MWGICFKVAKIESFDEPIQMWCRLNSPEFDSRISKVIGARMKVWIAEFSFASQNFLVIQHIHWAGIEFAKNSYFYFDWNRLRSLRAAWNISCVRGPREIALPVLRIESYQHVLFLEWWTLLSKTAWHGCESCELRPSFCPSMYKPQNSRRVVSSRTIFWLWGDIAQLSRCRRFFTGWRWETVDWSFSWRLPPLFWDKQVR